MSKLTTKCLALIFLGLVLTACGKEPTEFSRLTFSFAQSPQDESAGTNPQSMDLLSEITTLSTPIDPPPAIGGFNCYGVNVTGPGIAPNFGAGNCFNSQVRGPGIAGGFQAAGGGGVIELTVPSGKDRMIQLLALQSSGACPTLNDVAAAGGTLSGSTRPFEVASVIQDVLGDMTVVLTPQYDLATAESKRWFCGGAAAAPGPVIKVVSGNITSGAGGAQCPAGLYSISGGADCGSNAINASCSSSSGSTCGVNPALGGWWHGKCNSGGSGTVYTVCSDNTSSLNYQSLVNGTLPLTTTCANSNVAVFSQYDGTTYSGSCPNTTVAAANTCDNKFGVSYWNVQGATLLGTNSPLLVCIDTADFSTNDPSTKYYGHYQNLGNAASGTITCPPGKRAVFGSAVCGSGIDMQKSCPSTPGGSCLTTGDLGSSWTFTCASAPASLWAYVVCR